MPQSLTESFLEVSELASLHVLFCTFTQCCYLLPITIHASVTNKPNTWLQTNSILKWLDHMEWIGTFKEWSSLLNLKKSVFNLIYICPSPRVQVIIMGHTPLWHNANPINHLCWSDVLRNRAGIAIPCFLLWLSDYGGLLFLAQSTCWA